MKCKRCSIYIIGVLILWSLTGVFSVHAAEANWLWPLENYGQECIPNGGRFGDPRDGGARKHSGLDLSVQIGTPVRAMKSGWIVPKPYHVDRGFWMVIDHQDGSYTDYQHLNSYAIQSQRMVAQGEIIGYTGKSGSGNGPHLHFEIRTGARD